MTTAAVVPAPASLRCGFGPPRRSLRAVAGRAAALVAGALVLGGGMSGCVTYGPDPGAPAEITIRTVNSPAAEHVMRTALEWVLHRYPPPGAADGAFDGEAGVEAGEREPTFAINVTPPVRGRIYERIAAAGGPGAAPLTPETSHLPVYHVDALRIRGDTAHVSIFRPVPELSPTPAGETAYQEIRLDLRGGVSHRWRVINHREWTPGAAEPPEFKYFIPEPPPPQTGPARGTIW